MSASVLERFGAGAVDPLARVVIEVGSIADYARLAAFHYLAGPPATHVRVLAARDAGQTVGVLVVSMPTLDGAWRDVAWAGRYRARRAGERSACLRLLNAEVRTISRVVVDPRWRGLGLARKLVERYLAEPLTERTEAVCGIGAVCPFFARAGMREVPVPARRCTARLADAACHVARPEGRGVAPDVLCAPGFIRRELERWWRAHKTTRGRETRVEDMASEAFAAIVAPRCAYVSGGIAREEAGGRVNGSCPKRSDLPHPLTLFLSERQRAQVLDALGRIDPDRVRALMVALGLEAARGS